MVLAGSGSLAVTAIDTWHGNDVLRWLAVTCSNQQQIVAYRSDKTLYAHPMNSTGSSASSTSSTNSSRARSR
jgi:hypothetical protein